MKTLRKWLYSNLFKTKFLRIFNELSLFSSLRRSLPHSCVFYTEKFNLHLVLCSNKIDMSHSFVLIKQILNLVSILSYLWLVPSSFINQFVNGTTVSVESSCGLLPLNLHFSNFLQINLSRPGDIVLRILKAISFSKNNSHD